MIYPLFQEITYQDPLKIFYHFAKQSGSVFFDSAQLMEGCGRYSFICIDPFLVLNFKDDISKSPFDVLQTEIEKYSLQTLPDMPPFQGGVAGYLSYDLCHYLESLPHVVDEMEFSDLMFGFYDLVIAFDHELKRAWIFSSGYPEKLDSKRKQRAEQRCAWLLEELKQVADLPPISASVCDKASITSNFSQETYQKAVSKVIDYILDGDIFEANISQRFKALLPEGLSSIELYRRLRLCNPAPFSAYLNFKEIVLVSASPERFLQLQNGNVETRPIKGTRPRGKNMEEDKQFYQELLSSKKDHAENVMIVDLLRNDLSKICQENSVIVPQLCGLESYATVHHLVSVVKGTLKKNHSVIDLLRATFPGGSITGAPKIRSMEIIAEIEGLKRGPYCGCIAYIGFNGDLDSSIAIRTFAIKDNIVTFQAGGAIVAESDPFSEYMETMTKASALYNALTSVVQS